MIVPASIRAARRTPSERRETISSATGIGSAAYGDGTIQICALVGYRRIAKIDEFPQLAEDATALPPASLSPHLLTLFWFPYLIIAQILFNLKNIVIYIESIKLQFKK